MFSARTDRVLEEWAKVHALFIATEYQGYPVRSVDIVDDSGNSYQLWLEKDGDNVVVKAWDFRAQKTQYNANEDNLSEYLERTYRDVLAWIKGRGTSRTAYIAGQRIREI